MELAEYRNIFVQEDTHYYYSAVHDLVQKMLLKMVSSRQSLRILDAGCGTGGLSKKLERFGSVTGVDTDVAALEFSRSRGVNSLQASVESLPFAPGSFDVVVSIDVIYHQNVIDDESALKQFYDVLTPGGLLIIRVPAKKNLFCLHDKFVHTKRRYEKDELKQKLLKSKFEIKRLTFCQNLLFIPAWIKARVEEATNPSRKQIVSSIVRESPFVNNLCIKLLKIENWFLASNLDLPVGIGLLAVCRKPGSLGPPENG